MFLVGESLGTTLRGGSGVVQAQEGRIGSTVGLRRWVLLMESEGQL